MKRLWRKRRRRKARYGGVQRRTLKALGLKKLPDYGAIISEPRVVEEVAARVRQVLMEGFDVVIWFKHRNWETFEYWRRKVERTLELLRDLNPRDCRLDRDFHIIYLAPETNDRTNAEAFDARTNERSENDERF